MMWERMWENLNWTKSSLEAVLWRDYWQICAAGDLLHGMTGSLEEANIYETERAIDLGDMWDEAVTAIRINLKKD